MRRPTTRQVQQAAGSPGVVLSPGEQVPVFTWPLAAVDPVVAFVVYGSPAPQGSKRVVARGGKVVPVEMSAGLGAWRDAVRAMARRATRQWEREAGAAWEGLDEPVVVQAVVTMPASQAAVRSGRVFHTTTPDADKLTRAIGDALSPTPVRAGDVRGLPPRQAAAVREELARRRRREAVVVDDSRIVSWDVRKVYPSTTVDSLGVPGALVRVWRVADLMA